MKADRINVSSLHSKHLQIASRYERDLSSADLKRPLKTPTEIELLRSQYEQEIWFQLRERERLMDGRRNLAYAAQALLDYLELYVPVAKVPQKDKYLRLVGALKQAMTE